MKNSAGSGPRSRMTRDGAMRASLIVTLTLALAAPLGVAWAQSSNDREHDSHGGSDHPSAAPQGGAQAPRGGGAPASHPNGGAPHVGHFTAAPRFHPPGRPGEASPAQSFHPAPRSTPAPAAGARGFRDSHGSNAGPDAGRQGESNGHFPARGPGYDRRPGYARVEEHHYDRQDWQRHRHWDGGYWNGRYWPAIHDRSDFVWLLPTLPSAYVTYVWGGTPYYYYDDTYYTWDPADNGYVATEPPPVADGDADAPPEDSDAGAANPGAQLYAYPTQGQSPEQQPQDRQECQQWASSQAPPDADTYQRALKACFTGRGYSVE